MEPTTNPPVNLPPPVPSRSNLSLNYSNNTNNTNDFKKKLQFQLQSSPSSPSSIIYKKTPAVNNNNSNNINNANENGIGPGGGNNYISSPQSSPIHTNSNGISYTVTTNSPPLLPVDNSSYNNSNNLNSTFVETLSSSTVSSSLSSPSPSQPIKSTPPVPSKSKSKSSEKLSVKLLKSNSKPSLNDLHQQQSNPNSPTTPPSNCNIESIQPPLSSTTPSTSPQLPAIYSKYSKISLPQLPLPPFLPPPPSPLVQSTSSPSFSSLTSPLPPPPLTLPTKVPPLPPMRLPPPPPDQMYSNNQQQNNNESNSTTTSEGGLTPESESKLYEIASQPPSTPRLTHESKVIPSEIELLIKFYPSPSLSSGSLLTIPSTIEKSFIFSPCSTVDEILSIIIPNFQFHNGLKCFAKHTFNNEWEATHNDSTTPSSSIVDDNHESFALFNQQSPTIPLHKEKTILELSLHDRDVLILKTVSLVFTLVKVQIPHFTENSLSATATVKFNQFTSIRSIIRKLYLKYHNNVDISRHGIFLINDNNNNNGNNIQQNDESIQLEEEELFSTYNINSNSNLVFRTISNQENDLHSSQKILNLKILISSTFSRNNTLNLMFDPRDSVSKAIKVTGLRTGLLDSLNKCGFYLTPSEDDDEGFWMDEELTLEMYNLKNHTFLSFKERCKKYTVLIKSPDLTWRKCTFKFDQFTKVSTLFNILVNNENIKNPKDYHLVVKSTGTSLEKHRYLWSYDIKSPYEIEFKEYPNKLLIFNPQNGEKNFVYVDFNEPIKDVCARLSQTFSSPIDFSSMSATITNNSNSNGSSGAGGANNVNTLASSTNSSSTTSSSAPTTPELPPQVNHVRERSYTFKRLGQLNNTIDSRKSLKDQGVLPNDALMLEIIQDDSTTTTTTNNNNNSNSTTIAKDNKIKNRNSLPNSPTMIFEDLVKDGTILSEERQINIWEEPADSNENIIYSTTVTNNLNPEIDAATLNKLIIRLTNPVFHDLTFMKTFLMTYSSYTTTATLLKKLFERFQVPNHIDERERLSAQLRVANVIKYWVEHHYEDFCHESTKLMVDFVDTHMMIAFPTLGVQIRNCILKRTCGFKSELVRTRSNGALTSPRTNLSLSFTNSTTNSISGGGGSGSIANTANTSLSTSLLSSTNSISSSLSLSFNSGNNSPAISQNTPSSPSLIPSSPRPITSSSSMSSSTLLKSPQPTKNRIPETKTKGFANPRNLFDFDDEEIARQLTLYDFQLYTAIKPTEFLNQAWNKPSMASRKSPTILKIISRFNDISLWVVSLILEPDRVKTRAKRLKRIISIADELRKLNNYNTCIAVISGINNSAILRLKYTRGLLSKKYLDILENLEKEMSCEGSYKNYRDKLKNSDPPVVPYIGVYLTDLTFIEEGNPNIIRGNLINFAKYYLIYRVISEIQQYQWTEYQLNVAPIIQTFIRDVSISSTSDDLYHLSLLKEPRNALKSDIF
ncbi:hypothetical protein ACTFIV_008030 [Dictyostelium citrinum]